MKIALFGATGFTGKVVLQSALDAGHEVFALVRNPARVEITHERLTLLQGDALNEADVRSVLSHAEVILHCLGVGGKGNGKPTTLVSESIKLIVGVMPELGLKRIVCMSNSGVAGSGSWFANRIVIPLFLRWLLPLIEDKERMEAILSETDLEWCAIRLPNIVEGPDKPTRENADGKGLSFNITTASVATYMLAQAAAPALGLTTPSLSN